MDVYVYVNVYVYVSVYVCVCDFSSCQDPTFCEPSLGSATSGETLVEYL